MKTGFDNEKYLELQSKEILKRLKLFNNKLYLEFGGKLFDDLHASRVLPGFDPNIKIRLLEKLKDKLEIIICISADDIEKNKVRADFGITYDSEVLRLMDNLREAGLHVSSIVITLFEGEESAVKFKTKLENRGEKVYLHCKTKGYPNDINTIVSSEGFGANPYIKTTRPIVIVTAPGAKSGKLGTCLSQLYHEYKNGVTAGYAKFETFPTWNLPLKHMVNVAYEAATIEIDDVNMIDPYHLTEYGKVAVNYNRDIDTFPILKKILSQIGEKDVYRSPTDMGVNCVGFAITDEAVVVEAAKQEIIRRYFKAITAAKEGTGNVEHVKKLKFLMDEHSIEIYKRKTVYAARLKSEEAGASVIALEMPDGTIITGVTKDIISSSAAVVLNAIKYLAKIPDNIKLISPTLLEPILDYKKNVLCYRNACLNLKDVLMALSMDSKDNELIKLAYSELTNLKGLEAHSTHILNPSDENTFRRLKINLTSDPVFLSANIFDY